MVRWIPRGNTCLCDVEGPCFLCTVKCTCDMSTPECPWCEAERGAKLRHRIEYGLLKYTDILEKKKVESGLTKKMEVLWKWAKECNAKYDENMDIDYERAFVLKKMIKVRLRYFFQVTF